MEIKFIFVILYLSGINGQTYPLDPLTSAEIEASVHIIKTTFPIVSDEGWEFNWITLKEPEKQLLLPSFLGQAIPPISSIPRKAFVILLKRISNTVAEVVVDLTMKTVESYSKLPQGTQTMYDSDAEETLAFQIGLNDTRVQKRCRDVGWSNMTDVRISAWSITVKDTPLLRNSTRPMLLLFYGQLFKGDNFYAHPFDFVVLVDVATNQMLSIEDVPIHADYDITNRTGNTCPKAPGNYNPKFREAGFLRKDVKPIYFYQPGGAGYKLKGNEISWQKFKLRVGYNGREGLVINHVNYNDSGNVRPLFYRLSLASLFVAYGDPRPPFHWKFPFDESQFTLGFNAVDLEAAGVCRGGGNIAYLDVYLHDEKGEPFKQNACVCIHEEDAGLLWAHLDVDGNVLHTRSTRLTISSMYNLDNYDYVVSWRFYQDASVEFNVQLHGIVSTQLLAKGVTGTNGFGIAVAPQVLGQYHQHRLCLRMDTSIDGETNSVSTLDIVPVPGATGSATNPYGQGFTSQVTLLKTPLEARTNNSPSTGRFWLIQNPQKKHPYTQRPVTWKLIPYYGTPAFVRNDSPLHPIISWTDYNVWVTKYKDGQLYPEGLYLNGTDGLEKWVYDDPNANITETDIVLYYGLGFSHLPRIEDFPVMPVEHASVFLKPLDFFLENPAMDVPPTPKPPQVYMN